MKRIGVIGYGRRIESVLKNVVALAPDTVRVEAFHDISEKSIARVMPANPQLRLCRSVDELVGMKELDWVFIGSFNAAHRDHAIAAIEAGKHVFCEKPLATTKQHCLDILAAHRAHANQFFAVGFVLRYSSFYRRLKQWIDEGRLGELISMEFNETLAPQHGAAMHGNWRRHSKWAGPMILEKCCHDIDLMHWLTGARPARVASFGDRRFFKSKNANYNDIHPVGEQGFRYYERGLATGFAVGHEHNTTPFSDDKDTIDNQVAIMQLSNGVNVSFHFCMHSAQLERRFYLCGTRGTIRGDVLTGTLEYTPVEWSPQTELVRPITGGDHGAAEEPMARDILACMFQGIPMPTTAEEGVAASFTCLGIEEARQTGKVIDMSEYWTAMRAPMSAAR